MQMKNNINPRDIRRITGRLTDKELRRLPASINNLVSSTELSRTKVLEQEGIIPQQAHKVVRTAKTNEERIDLKEIKKQCGSPVGRTIKLN